MKKLQQQLIESCIDTKDVFDTKKITTKSYSDEMEKKRQNEQLIMEARIRNIKKNYQQKYETLHQTYLYQSEQLKQQLQSEIKKEMYTFEKKMESFLKQISDNDKNLNKSGLSMGLSKHLNYNSYGQLNHETQQSEQTLNQSSVNDLFNFVDSHENSLFHKNPNNLSFLQAQISNRTFNNQPNSFRTLGGTNFNNMQANRILLTEEEFNDRMDNKNQQINQSWNKENLLDSTNSFLNKTLKNKSILKNTPINNSKYNENILTQKIINSNNEASAKRKQNQQNKENLSQTSKSKNWEEIKQIRQKSKEQSQYHQAFSQTSKAEKSYSCHGNRNQSSLYNVEQQKPKQQDNRRNLNNSYQIQKQQDNSFSNYHNLSFTNLGQFDNGMNNIRCSSSTSSDSEGERQLDTDRLKRFKIDNINVIKNIKSNYSSNKASRNSYYKK